MINNNRLRFKADDGSEFPEWEERRFGDIATGFDYGMNAAAVDYDGLHRYIRITDIFEDSHKYDKDNPVSPSGDISTKYLVRENDILFARTGASVGKSYIYSKDDGELYYAGFLIRMTVNNECNSYFVFLNTLTPQYEKWVKLISARTGQPGINAEQYKQYKCSIPHIEEQKKIADFFSTYDEKVSLQQQKVEALERRKKGLLQKVFSQEIRFKADDGTEFPEWEEDIVGNLMEVTSVKRVHESDWTECGVPFYRAREIVALHNGESVSPLYISESLFVENIKKSGKIAQGDLLVTGVGTVGVQYLVKSTDKFYFKDGNIIWFKKSACNQLNGQYFYYLFDAEYIKKQIRDMAGIGTVATYTIENAKRTRIYIPSYDEQQKIADFFSAIDEQIEIEKKRLESMQTIKKGLLQQMFCDGSAEEKKGVIYTMPEEKTALSAAQAKEECLL